jgi:hypothetical protein
MDLLNLPISYLMEKVKPKKNARCAFCHRHWLREVKISFVERKEKSWLRHYPVAVESVRFDN